MAKHCRMAEGGEPRPGLRPANVCVLRPPRSSGQEDRGSSAARRAVDRPFGLPDGLLADDAPPDMSTVQCRRARQVISWLPSARVVRNYGRIAAKIVLRPGFRRLGPRMCVLTRRLPKNQGVSGGGDKVPSALGTRRGVLPAACEFGTGGCGIRSDSVILNEKVGGLC